MKTNIKLIGRIVISSKRGFSLIEILIALALLAGAGTFVAGKIFDQLHEGKVESSKMGKQRMSHENNKFTRLFVTDRERNCSVLKN